MRGDLKLNATLDAVRLGRFSTKAPRSPPGRTTWAVCVWACSVGLWWSLVLKNWECRAKKSFGVEYGDWIDAHGAQRRDITGGKRETSKYKRDASERG